MEQAIQQTTLLSQLTPKEAKRLFQTVMIEYDQPFSLVSVNRKEKALEVAVDLQKGGRRLIKL